MEDVAGIFTQNENIKAILDISAGLGMLSEMKFWEFAMFWVEKKIIFFFLDFYFSFCFFFRLCYFSLFFGSLEWQWETRYLKKKWRKIFFLKIE